VSEALAISRLSAERVQVSGRIDVRNAADALGRRREIAVSGTQVEVDLAQLESADSVTLSVLLAWAAHAAQQSGNIVFTQIPPRLRAIAHLSKAEALLGANPA
jgi:ABC-type transporter Mla MlaB component